jgi:hypothetical protein
VVKVDPQLFAAQMERRWLAYPTTSKPRICTPALRHLWARLATIFNDQLAGDSSAPHPVIPAELGAGKSTAIKVWSSLLPLDSHPGILIVVRTTRDAEKMAADVNEWAGREVAFAYHYKLDDAVKRDLAALAGWPVLVICHKGYEVSLNRYAMSDTHAKFEAMHRFRDGRRAMVFIDESLDLVYQARLKQTEMDFALDKIPTPIKRHHLDAYDVLLSVNRALLSSPKSTRVALRAEDLLARTAATPDEADVLLRTMWEDIRHAKKLDKRVRVRIGDVLAAISRHLALYRWADGDSSISGARLLVPPEAALVVMDATGSLNAVYQRSSFYKVIDDLQPVRSYQPATTYVIRARGTGIRAMDEEVDRIANDTLELVLKHYGERARERRVLVVTNQRSEAAVRAIWGEGKFASLDVIHWGDIDGRNDFTSCDTLVTLTLPYAHLSHDLAVYLALTGEEPGDDGLNDPPDDVRTLREVRVAGQLAQAMGRIGIRDLTREDGACEPADIFCRLPHWDKVVRTDVVLEHLQRVLRGVQVVELAREAMVDWVGKYGDLFKVGLLERPGHIAKRTWIRLVKDARRPGGQLYQHLDQAGLEVAVAGGRLYVQAKGAGPALTPSERAVVALALDLVGGGGSEVPLSRCGLSEDARRRAVKRPRVVGALDVLGIRVDVRPGRLGGAHLVR